MESIGSIGQDEQQGAATSVCLSNWGDQKTLLPRDRYDFAVLVLIDNSPPERSQKMGFSVSRAAGCRCEIKIGPHKVAPDNTLFSSSTRRPTPISSLPPLGTLDRPECKFVLLCHRMHCVQVANKGFQKLPTDPGLGDGGDKKSDKRASRVRPLWWKTNAKTV